MRLLGVLVALIVLVGLVYLVLSLIEGSRQIRLRRASKKAQWKIGQQQHNATTDVVIRRVGRAGRREVVYQTIVVASIANNAPDWPDQMIAAKQEAEERLSALRALELDS